MREMVCPVPGTEKGVVGVSCLARGARRWVGEMVCSVPGTVKGVVGGFVPGTGREALGEGDGLPRARHGEGSCWGFVPGTGREVLGNGDGLPRARHGRVLGDWLSHRAGGAGDDLVAPLLEIIGNNAIKFCHH